MKLEDLKNKNKKKDVFDYGNIKEEHKDAAIEIISILEKLGQGGITSELIKQKFEITEIPKYDVTKSTFGNFCKQKDIFVATQGWVTEEENLEKKQYPYVSVNEDIRKLDDLADFIFQLGKNSHNQ
jgi:hypothetical protein